MHERWAVEVRATWRVNGLALLLLVSITAVACGHASRDDNLSAAGLASSSDTGGQASQQETTTTLLDALSLAPLNYSLTVNMRNMQGYTATAELDRGTLIHAQPMENSGVPLDSACDVNFQTDAVEPFHLSVTNTTPNFSADPVINVWTHVSTGNYTGNVYAFSRGSDCVHFGYLLDDNTSDVNLTYGSNGGLQPGQNVQTNGFIIVKGYYSPAYPNGDHASVGDNWISFGPFSGRDFTIVGGTGGTTTVDGTWPAQPLDPTQSPSRTCSLTFALESCQAISAYNASWSK